MWTLNHALKTRSWWMHVKAPLITSNCIGSLSEYKGHKKSNEMSGQFKEETTPSDIFCMYGNFSAEEAAEILLKIGDKRRPWWHNQNRRVFDLFGRRCWVRLQKLGLDQWVQRQSVWLVASQRLGYEQLSWMQSFYCFNTRLLACQNNYNSMYWSCVAVSLVRTAARARAVVGSPEVKMK